MTIRRNLLRAGTVGAASTLILTACGGDSGDSEATTLTMASWGGMFTEAAETYAEQYEEETGVHIQIVDAPGQYTAQLEAQTDADNVEWDLLDSTSAPDAYIMYDGGLVQEMPDEVREALEESMGIDDPIEEFGLAYSILGYTLGCVEADVDTCPDTVPGFFDAESYPGDRSTIATAPMINLSLAELANGVPREELGDHDIDLDAAFETLQSIRDEITVFWDSADMADQVYTTGEAELGIVYSNRPYIFTEDYDVPTTPVWEDGLYNPGYMQVVEGSGNEEAAWDFIEWLGTNPEVQAEWAESMGYSVPHPEAFNYLDDSIAERLADTPENRELLANVNYAWYVENADEVNDRWQEFLGQ